MCGVAGLFVRDNHHLKNDLKEHIKQMVISLKHRGPNYQNFFVDKNSALGHSRLAIIDLTKHANQPFQSSCGRYYLVFNGEIYNYRQLRQSLQAQGISFSTQSDTEVLLQCLIVMGIDKTLQELNGMYSFGFFDRVKNNLTLVRDKFGIKPLYYTYKNGLFAFASELKAFKTLPINFAIDDAAVVQFMSFSYIPSLKTIYKDCFKLNAGQYLQINIDELDNYTLHSYWQSKNFISEERKPFDKEEFKFLALDAVKIRMQADVKLGAFLSGGIDSSLIVSLMSNLASEKVKTFSIGFIEKDFNEAPFACQVANHLGTQHYEQILSFQDVFDIIPKLATVYDEPFADSSQIPTMLVSAMAKKEVTVALSGDGGDEVFGGYSRYFWAEKLAKMSRQPQFIQQLRRRCVQLVSKFNSYFFKNLFLPTQLKFKLQKLNHLLSQKNYSYKLLAPQIFHTENILQKTQSFDNYYIGQFIDNNLDSFEQAMLVDTLTYLPNDILTKVDRASMNYSLEVRTPLLDHRLVQYAWSLSKEDKANKWQGKLPLRQLLQDYLPNHLIERPKLGFSIPLAQWLRSGLKEWGEDLLHSQHLKNHHLFNYQTILNRWQSHQQGKMDFQDELWNVLMYLSWEQTKSY